MLRGTLGRATRAALVEANRAKEAIVELERLRSVTDDLYQDLRESISELRTRVSERGLPAMIREYVDEYEDRHGSPSVCKVRTRREGSPRWSPFSCCAMTLHAK